MTPPPDDDSYLQRVVSIFWITMDGARQPNRVDPISGTLQVIEQHDGNPITSIAGLPVALETRIGLRIRGFSSAYLYAQKPYSIELRDAAGVDLDRPLLGLPAESDWVLSSCYSDKTCLRNVLTYALARQLNAMGGVWAPRTRFAEVYLDGNYRGLYQLVEKPKGSRARMNFTRPTPADLSGAYMFSSDGDMTTYRDNPLVPMREWFDARANTRWEHRFPDENDITPEQKAYIIRAVDELHTALQGGPTAWRPRVDARSWMDYFVISELSNNVDAFFRSWYVHKRPDSAGGRFGLGPVWDFDLGYGNVNYSKRYCATTSILATAAPPFAAVLRDATFSNEMRCHWHQLRKDGGPLDVKRIEGLIDAFAAHIQAAKGRDAARWNNIGKLVWPNNYVGATWSDEVTYLKYWIRQRIRWMDAGGLKGTCTTTPAPPTVAAIPQPAQTANDRRMEQALASPPQFRPGIDPPAFIPLVGEPNPQWACPAQ